MHAGFIESAAHLIEVWFLGELHVDQGATLEVDAKRDAVPEEDGEKPGDAEDQRKPKEVPLLAEEIDVGILKKFHVYC